MTTGAWLSLVDSFVAFAQAIAWPVVVAFVLWLFRSPIARLIDRIKRVGVGGAYADAEVSQSPPSASGPLNPLNQGGPTLSAPDTAPPSAGEQRVSLDSFVPSIYRGAMDALLSYVNQNLPILESRVEGTREQILTQWLAETMLNLILERATRSIFQSQVTALDTLKEKTDLTREDFRPFYEATARVHPEIFNESNFSFDKWFSYFTAWKLIQVQGDTIKVSPLGKSVKRFITDNSYVLSQL
jgi:hypothetical protein